jgi:hypothetical protein
VGVQQKLGFVIGGAQKGGTTTLDALFRRHPGLQMATIKETHFFDDEQRDWASPDYRQLDANFPIEDDRLRGEATPITLYWRPAVRRLHVYNPDIKFIALLRDPITRAFSHWRHEYRAGRETLPFSIAIRRGRDRVAQMAETEGLHRSASYIERGLYGAQLAYLLEHFPKANVHCEISEEFHAGQPAGLQRLADFLRIAPFPDDIDHTHRHPAPETDDPAILDPDDIAYLTDVFRQDMLLLESILNRSVDIWRSLEPRQPAQARRE